MQTRVEPAAWQHRLFVHPALGTTCPEPTLQAVALRSSANLLEGSTGCHQWQAGTRLAEYILSQSQLFRGDVQCCPCH